MLDPEGVQNVWGWRLKQFRVFIHALNHYFKGTVIWMTQSKWMIQDCGYFYADARIRLLDMEVVPFIQSEPTGRFTMDIISPSPWRMIQTVTILRKKYIIQDD